jgi:uncharacterized protein (DUF1800 family)
MVVPSCLSEGPAAVDVESAEAQIRFGIGRNSVIPIPGDPVAWLKIQITDEDGFDSSALPTSSDVLAARRDDRADRKIDPTSHPRREHLLQDLETQAFSNQALNTDSGFRERLVWFWINHFTVSTSSGIGALAGTYTHEAIRPYVTGKFRNMALAVMRHPAMLMYLNNVQSIGPNSREGLRTNRGLNENLAREFMELHTVGLEAAYTQADVTSFARILTGWSVEENREPLGFVFRPGAAEPGSKQLLGHTFAEGEDGGIEAISFLATHPSTYRHIALKLAVHFIADNPPPQAVDKLSQVLAETDGDLGQVSLALVNMPDVWNPPAGRLNKLRTPLDYSVAVLRAVNLPAEKQPNLVAVLNRLGEPLWRAPLPNGWPDQATGWLAPEAMLVRMDWAYGVASRADDSVEASDVALNVLGPMVQPATLEAVRHAPSRRAALTLVLGSPEFMRR